MGEFANMVRFGKARVLLAIMGHGLAFTFVDLFHFRYWQFAIWFIPANFFVTYFVNKWVFQKVWGKEK
jgi:hypothetical protein